MNANELRAKIGQAVPAEYVTIIDNSMLNRSVLELDACLSDIITAGDRKEKAYADKKDLIKKKIQLDTEIKLVESEAIMAIEGEARSQYVVIGDKKTALPNDTARDAYRRMASKDQRTQLAAVEAEIAAIDVEIARANDAWYTAKEANDTVRAKANVQAALLNFLANR